MMVHIATKLVAIYFLLEAFTTNIANGEKTVIIQEKELYSKPFEETYYEVEDDNSYIDFFYDIENDIFSKFIGPLENKLYKKIEEKKFIYDVLFNLWLGILESKKKVLFKIWKKKFVKKESESKHYEFYLPYYSSTHKPPYESPHLYSPSDSESYDDSSPTSRSNEDKQN